MNGSGLEKVVEVDGDVQEVIEVVRGVQEKEVEVDRCFDEIIVVYGVDYKDVVEDSSEYKEDNEVGIAVFVGLEDIQEDSVFKGEDNSNMIQEGDFLEDGKI